MSQQDLFNLAKNVFDGIYRNTNSFENDVGMQSLYVLGAILNDSAIELDRSIPEDASVVLFYNDIFPADHGIWKHIKVM